MACYSVHYTVEGTDPFPFDMLRYDGSYPESGGNLPHAEHQRGSGVYTIALVQVGPDKAWRPTEGRWKSFGWRVVVTGSAQRIG